jgi:hypothetical protein
MNTITNNEAAGSLVEELQKYTLPFDSWEVFELYYHGKIKVWEDQLQQLNVLDHPVEIEAICRQIIAVKNLLRRMKQQNI